MGTLTNNYSAPWYAASHYIVRNNELSCTTLRWQKRMFTPKYGTVEKKHPAITNLSQMMVTVHQHKYHITQDQKGTSLKRPLLHHKVQKANKT